MLKVIWFLIRLGLVAGAAGFLAQHPGHLSITWQGYLIETSVAFLLAVLAVFLVIWTLGVRLWRSFVSVPKTYRRYQIAVSRENGYRAVTEGLVAVAAGDGRAAEKLSRRAEKLIPDMALTRLLTAQTALMNGDAPKARREFAALLEDDSAAFFGLRGLLNDTLRQGDYREALVLARKAEKLQPKRIWVIRTLFDLETRNRDWDKAEKTLRRAEKLGIFDKNAARHHRQALFMAQSNTAQTDNNTPAALKFAKEAFALDAGFSPAALRLVDIYDAQGKSRAVLKTIESAWRVSPHPALAARWMEKAPVPKKTPSLYEAGREAFDWAKKLYDLQPNHRESARMLGLAALQARQWRDARQYLEQACDYRALARLEREESGDETRARDWLEQAADAPPDARWICTHCGHAAQLYSGHGTQPFSSRGTQQWRALCPHCQSFNKLAWLSPGTEVRSVQELSNSPADGHVISPPSQAMPQSLI